MSTQTNTLPRPLIWAAGIAIIVFCMAGLAAIMGWIPTSTGQANPSGTTPAPQVKSGVAPSKPARAAQPSQEIAPDRAASTVASRCNDCGVVESVRATETRGEGTGLGGVGGAVVGGVLGNQVGGGRGKDVATVLGAVGGAVAGNEIERRARSTVGTDVTVRMDAGGTRVIHENGSTAWRAGERVKIIDGQLQRN